MAIPINTRLSVKAKRANQRLRQLEKSGKTKSSIAYRWVEEKAYDKESYITTTKKGEMKFATSFRNMTKKQKENYENVLDKFLGAKSSTVKGIKRALEKAYDTFSENNPEYGDIDEDTYEEIWTDDIIKEINNKYGYEEVLRIVQEVSKKTKGNTIKEINKKLDNVNIENSTLSDINIALGLEKSTGENEGLLL